MVARAVASVVLLFTTAPALGAQVGEKPLCACWQGTRLREGLEGIWANMRAGMTVHQIQAAESWKSLNNWGSGFGLLDGFGYDFCSLLAVDWNSGRPKTDVLSQFMNKRILRERDWKEEEVYEANCRPGKILILHLCSVFILEELEFMLFPKPVTKTIADLGILDLSPLLFASASCNELMMQELLV